MQFKCFSNRLYKSLLNNTKCLTPYIMAGEHNLNTNLFQLQSLSKLCDIIEVGIPFSNPVADGKTIQSSSQKSLANNTKVNDVFSLVHNFRKINDKTSIILMTYFNIVYKNGIENFAKKCCDNGVDGIIICDLPLEELLDIITIFNKYSIDVISLVTNLTSKQRMIKISQQSSGFVYFVSVLGVTGTKKPSIEDIKNKIEDLNEIFKIPKFIGFGIDTPNLAKTMYSAFDGIIIGSYFINFFNNNCLNKINCYQIFEEEVKKFVF